MCMTVDEITKENIVIQELDDYIAGNGDRKDTLVMRVLKQNMITNIQIQQDLEPLAKNMRESPSLLSLFKNKTLKTAGVVALLSFFMFMVFFTFVEVVGYAEALAVFK